jgi:hypothetical protein
MFYLIWITYACVLYSTYAFTSVRVNDSPSLWGVGILLLIGACGPWPVIAIFSKNVVFDSLLLDVIIYLAFYVTCVSLGAAAGFTLTQWIGVIVMSTGIAMVKIWGA